MNSLKKFLRSLAAKLDWLPGLVSRLTLGFIFIQSGWGKITHLDRVVDFFMSLGIPAAHLQAPFVAGVELVCGILVLIGLFTRIAAIPLMGTMVVAILTAKLPGVKEFADFLSLSEYLFLVLLVWLAIKGGGCLSVDHLLCKESEKNK